MKFFGWKSNRPVLPSPGIPDPGCEDDLICLRSLTRRFANNLCPAVDAINLCIRTGQVTAILGPSGAGKTTILRLIAGFERQNSGEILIRNSPVSNDFVSMAPERRGLGMVFQDYALFPHLTVSQNVAFGLGFKDRHQRQTRVMEVLDLVHMEEFGHRYPHQLSGGQQQRVALARALAPEPVALLMDEPFSNLDNTMRREMQSRVTEILKRSGVTTVLVTHDQEAAFAVADRVAMLRTGHLEQVDTPFRLYNNPNNPFVASLSGDTNFLPGDIHEKGVFTEIGWLARQSLDNELDKGMKVDVLLRPEDLQLVPDASGDATVTAMEFRGADTFYRIALPSDRTLFCHPRPDPGLIDGQRVTVVPVPERSFNVFKRVT